MRHVLRGVFGLTLLALTATVSHAAGPELRIVADCVTTVAAPGAPAVVPIVFEAKIDDASGERNEVSALDFTIDFDEGRFTVGEQDVTLPAAVDVKWDIKGVEVDDAAGTVQVQVAPKFQFPLPVFDDGPVAQLKISALPSAPTGCVPLSVVPGSVVYSKPPIGLPIPPGALVDGEISREDTVPPTPTPTPTPTITPAPDEVCDDCWDNDGDGAIDRDDADCTGPVNGQRAHLGTEDQAKAAVKCQKALGKAGQKYVDIRQKRLGKCVDKVFACIQKNPGDNACVIKAREKCAREKDKLAADETKLSDTITKSCGAGKLAEENLIAVEGLGYHNEESPCAAMEVDPLASVADVIDCVQKQHACRAEAVVGLQSPRAAKMLEIGGLEPTDYGCLPNGAQGAENLGDPKGQGKSAVACAKTVQKAGAKYIATQLKSVRKCTDAVFKCLQRKPDDAACIAKTKTNCAKVFAKLEDLAKGAAAKLASAIEKKCGDPTKLTFANLMAANGVGFGSYGVLCGALGIPSLDSIDQVIACLTRQHRCRAQQMLENEVPRLHELLAEGGGSLD